MTQPWLSVLIPVYNGEAYLASALDSVAIQEDGNIECIIVDGESTDSTLSILKSYQDRLPIRILQRERNSNWVIKTNYAFSFARGEHICFLHHDDVWLNDRLKTMKWLVTHFPHAVLYLHPSRFIDHQGKNLGTWRCPLPSFPEIINSKMMIERLLVQNFISILGPVFKRETALKVGGLDESLWYTADWDFWLRIAHCGDTLYYPRPLSEFRIHPTSQTVVRSSRSQEFRDQLESVARKHLVRWEAPESLKQKVSRVSRFSNEVNIALAGAAHGQKNNLIALLFQFLLLSPSGWYRYLRDSRIWERASARVKAQIRPASRIDP